MRTLWPHGAFPATKSDRKMVHWCSQKKSAKEKVEKGKKTLQQCEGNIKIGIKVRQNKVEFAKSGAKSVQIMSGDER